jgi:UDP-2,4-diacetamido-2,4,6-trideoxy-beta-L-altropyranose hydrolase
MDITIRCDVGKEIGLGHYYRCTLLKRAFEQNGINAHLVVKSLGECVFNLPCDLLIDSNYSEEIEKYNFQYHNLLLDLYHHKSHSSVEFPSYITSLKKNHNKVAFIEGVENDECPASYYPYFDVLVSPYISKKSKKKHPTHFFGKDFLILDTTRIFEKKNINKNANKVLITFGGSDPWNQSLDVLKTLFKDKRCENLEITVVIGPLMSQEQVEMIERAASFFKAITVAYTPKNLKNLFKLTDLAITNSGQTRYELAASGVPFIILPFNEAGYRQSLIFSELEAAHLEKCPQNSTTYLSADILLNLLKDHHKRKDFSVNGRKYFYNPNGPNNLVKALMQAWK